MEIYNRYGAPLQTVRRCEENVLEYERLLDDK